MRRGCRVLLVHFHSYPILSRASQEKVRELARILAGYQFHSRLFLVPFGEIQQQVTLSVAPPLRVVIYRRLMMRIAEQIARQNRAQALVTGEVVGQVASQTLENLASINQRRHHAGAASAHRPRQGRNHRARRSGWAPTRSRSFRIRTAARCSLRVIPRRRRVSVDVERAEATLPVDEIVQARRGSCGGRGLPIP